MAGIAPSRTMTNMRAIRIAELLPLRQFQPLPQDRVAVVGRRLDVQDLERRAGPVAGLWVEDFHVVVPFHRRFEDGLELLARGAINDGVLLGRLVFGLRD